MLFYRWFRSIVSNIGPWFVFQMAPAKVKFCKMDKVKFKKQKIAAAGMSGGVDSAVAALLL